jgi:hypothetical protein
MSTYLTSCEGVTVAKGLRHGTIIILDCNGYQRENADATGN